MQDYIYSAIAFVAMAIHLIINSSLRPGKMVVSARGVREYHWFLKSVFAYYIADAGWGVFAGLRWTKVLYVDTMFYFIAMALTVLAWCHFVAVHLDLSKWKSRALSWFGYALLALYVVLLAANVFNDCLFHFDAQGAYVAGFVRGLIFYPLAVLNVLMGGFVLARTLGSRGQERKRNMVTLFFCLTMAVAIVFQIIWPLWPYYALGCLIGCCFFHVFVVEDERDELRRVVFEREETEKHAVELEKALERARAAEKSKNMFFSIVSHDIRTPLNAILGYSELLQKGIESESEREEALKSIQSSGTTLLELVNDVLDLAKMDAGKMTLSPEPVQLAKLTDEVFASFHMAADGKGLKLVNRTADVPTLSLDEHRFRQILFNLVGNAVKFTAKGSVAVAASYVDRALQISVSDTGCGIPADILPRILDPFVQVQDASHSADRVIGTGLGLSICRSLVDVMGGELVVESELGKGSTFSIVVPGVEAVGGATGTTGTTGTNGTGDLKSAPTVSSVASVPVVPSSSRILVVDDSQVNRSVLTAFLKRAGVASIDHACDGEEALGKIDSATKAGRPYDFVFSDFWMPNMNGLEMIEKLRADSRFGNLPVFALTADTEINGDKRTKLFTGILLKPITYDKLIDVFK